MVRTSPALALLLATPLLSGCHTGGSDSAPEAPPWAATYGGIGPITTYLAADPSSGAVAMAGSFQGDIDLGGGKLSGIGFDDDVFVGMLAADGKPMWSGATGSPGEQVAGGVAFDPDGNMIVAGWFTNTVNFGNDKLTALQQDAFMAKLDQTGKAKWVKHWSGDDGGPSGAGSITPTGVVATGDGITFGGYFTGSIGFGGPPLENMFDFGTTSFVARVDHEGRHLFSVAFPGQVNAVSALAVDEGGDVYVAGTNSASIDIGGGKFTTAGQNCAYATRLAPDGTPRWAFQIGADSAPNTGLGNSSSTAIAVDSHGDAYIVGTYSGKILIDQITLTTFGVNGFVLKVSHEGKPLWAHDFPDATITGLALDEAGRVVVGGSYATPADFGGGKLPELDTLGAFMTTLEPDEGKHVGTLVLGVPDLRSQIDRLVISGKDAIVTGNFVGALQLPTKQLTESYDNGFGLSFVARIGL